MKRSQYIALGAIGVLVAATVWPTGQTEDFASDPAVNAGRADGFQTLAFANLAECKDSQAVTAAICDTEYGKASQQSVADAPKFQALTDCEAEYGANQCRPATWNGASVFIPALAGVLIARSLAGAGQVTSQPLYAPRTGPAACPPNYSPAERPECQQRSGSSSSSSGGGSGGSSSGRRYYSTGAGRVVSRVGTAVAADMILPPRSTVSRTTVAPRGSVTSAASGSSFGRSTTSSSSYSSSPTVSRGGFGSSGGWFSGGS
jgi:uncharacterized protein YgiB involved in biofilm formation